MPRGAALKPEQVPADSKPTLDAFTEDIGFTPDMMAPFALSPICRVCYSCNALALCGPSSSNTTDLCVVGCFRRPWSVRRESFAIP